MGDSVSFNNKLTRRVLIYILLCSSFLSVCSTMFQLWVDYNEEVDALNERLVNIELSYVDSISTSLWDFNEAQLEQQIQGIENLPGVRYVKIVTDIGQHYEHGQAQVNFTESVTYPVVYDQERLGSISIYANYREIYERLQQRAWLIISAEFIRIFIVAFLIMIIVHMLITRHIYRITAYSQSLASDNLDDPLKLKFRPNSPDELDMLAEAINGMRLTLQSDIEKLEEAENALIKLNGELEVKVYDRTEKLAQSNKQLQESLDDLTLAKDSLVQSEKMASLGQLVAGVAHEVNTPLGICVTSITALKEKVQRIITLMDEEKLTKSQLTSTLELLVEYQQIIERSLNKAVELIRGFKSVAVEQHTDPELKINLAQHVNDVVNTVKTMFKRKNYTIDVQVDPNLDLVTYPSAWNQILTNFLMNSHIHGFEERDSGEMSIIFSQNNGYLTLEYADDGRGISDEVRKRIFDPFVTTKRGQGGSGLGMNIVFNLVHSKLGGTIKCIRVDSGSRFQVKVPIVKEQLSNVTTLTQES